MDELDAIQALDLPDIDKLARMFDLITQRIIAHAETEVEVARAMQDKEAVVKTQIKLSTIRHARAIFSDCFWHIAARKVWVE